MFLCMNTIVIRIWFYLPISEANSHHNFYNSQRKERIRYTQQYENVQCTRVRPRRYEATAIGAGTSVLCGGRGRTERGKFTKPIRCYFPTPTTKRINQLYSQTFFHVILVCPFLLGVLKKRVSCARGRSIADPRQRRHRHPAEIFQSFCEEKLARCSTFEI